MMTLRNLQTSLLLGLVALMTQLAQAGDPLDTAADAKLRQVLEVPGTGLKVDSIEPSEIPGLYEVQFLDGPIIYSTADGGHFVLGDMFQVEEGGYINLAEKRRDSERAAELDAVPASQMITFSPKGETKTHITVFTDVTCYYCQKLHLEVPELNEKGIEVRYLAYPRAGVDSDGFRKLASAWCADDRQTTITRLKEKQAVPENVCAGNPVAQQYAMGQSMGVRGTPAIVTENGQMLPGYRSADELAEILLGQR